MENENETIEKEPASGGRRGIRIPLYAAVCAALLLAALAAVISFQCTYLAQDRKHRADLLRLREEMAVSQSGVPSGPSDGEGLSEAAYAKLAEVDALWRSQYIGELDEDYLTDCLISGYVAGTGDRYAYYMNAADFSDYMEEMNGSFTGIGVYVIFNAEQYAIEIINVVEGSPAEAGGLVPGDMIIGVEGQDVAELGYYAAVAACRGEEGTPVTLTLWRDGETFEQTFTRKTVESVSVESRMLEDRIGLVKISEFEANTPDQFKTAVKQLMAAGAESLIFDVRYNPGGDLDSIVSVLDFLLPEGPIVRITDGSGEQVAMYESDAFEIKLPIAVLLNGSTASAAELFSSALHDYEKATLIGTTSFGKGTVQTVRMLSDGSGVGISYMLYCPPFSENYEGVGIEPDIEVELSEEAAQISPYKLADEDDAQLQAAIAYLTDQN